MKLKYALRSNLKLDIEEIRSSLLICSDLIASLIELTSRILKEIDDLADTDDGFIHQVDDTSDWDEDRAFREARESGRLSDDPKSENYHGKYVFMGPCIREGVRDAFKHHHTKEPLI
tara:strand:+ start:2748 stop:3098 length:351 start_codon:yes stop_codon:yes gene_type:complete